MGETEPGLKYWPLSSGSTVLWPMGKEKRSDAKAKPESERTALCLY